MAGKRILIFTNHFYPEDFKVNDVAFMLAKEGHEVTVITGLPNYPKGRIFKGYGLFAKSRETIQGVRVIRLPLIPRGNGKAIRLIFNYLSFAFSIVLYSFYISLRRKFDAVFVHHTSPIFIGIGALIVKRMQRIKIYFWNLDLWPESVSATTGIQNKFFIGLLNRIVRWIYKHCDVMLIGSKGFEQSVKEKGVPAQKIVYLPNWAEDIFTITAKDMPEIPTIPKNGFKIMFAGNIGEAQDFENIVKAAELLKNTDIRWLIVGDGRKRPWLEEHIKISDLQDTFILLGRHPLESMPGMFLHADVMLVSLKDKPIFKLTVPAKVQAYMASGKPIMAMLNGEGASLLEEANCGYICNAEDYESLAEKIYQLRNLSKSQLELLGENGKIFYQEHFAKEKNIGRLLDLIMSGQITVKQSQ